MGRCQVNVRRRPVNRKTVNRKSVNRKAMNRKSVNRKAMNRKSSRGLLESAGGWSSGEQSVYCISTRMSPGDRYPADQIFHLFSQNHSSGPLTPPSCHSPRCHVQAPRLSLAVLRHLHSVWWADQYVLRGTPSSACRMPGLLGFPLISLATPSRSLRLTPTIP